LRLERADDLGLAQRRSRDAPELAQRGPDGREACRLPGAGRPTAPSSGRQR